MVQSETHEAVDRSRSWAPTAERRVVAPRGPEPALCRTGRRLVRCRRSRFALRRLLTSTDVAAACARLAERFAIDRQNPAALACELIGQLPHTGSTAAIQCQAAAHGSLNARPFGSSMAEREPSLRGAILRRPRGESGRATADPDLFAVAYGLSPGRTSLAPASRAHSSRACLSTAGSTRLWLLVFSALSSRNCPRSPLSVSTTMVR